MSVPGFEQFLENGKKLSSNRIEIFNIMSMEVDDIAKDQHTLIYRGFRLYFCMRKTSLDHPRITRICERIPYSANMIFEMSRHLGNYIGAKCANRMIAINQHARYVQGTLELAKRTHDEPIDTYFTEWLTYLDADPENKIGFVCFCKPQKCHTENYKNELMKQMHTNNIPLHLPNSISKP